MARPVKHQTALLLDRLGRHEPHVGSRDGLTNRLRVRAIVLLPLDVRLHIGRRHQSHRMPQRLQLADQWFDDQAWRQLLEKNVGARIIPPPAMAVQRSGPALFARYWPETGTTISFPLYRASAIRRGSRSRCTPGNCDLRGHRASASHRLECADRTSRSHQGCACIACRIRCTPR